MSSEFLTIGAVCRSADELSIERIDREALGPDDVLVATRYSGLSTGTDRWVMQGRFTWSPIGFPLVPGYQRSGIVVAVGDEVSDVAVGDEVAALHSRGFIGVSPKWGSHVSLAVSPREHVFDAAGIEPRAASLVVSAQVGYNAASRVDGERGSRVLVIGDGIIGASAALASRARGLEPLLVGRHQDRRSAIERAGIPTIDATDETAARDWGATSVIDTAQGPESGALALESLPARWGQIVYSGHSPDGTTAWADMAALQMREITAEFVAGWTRDRVTATLSLMRTGLLPIDTFVGAVATSHAEATELLQTARSGRIPALATIIDWSWAS